MMYEPSQPSEVSQSAPAAVSDASIPMITVDSLARVEPTVMHKDLISELLAPPSPLFSPATNDVCFLTGTHPNFCDGFHRSFNIYEIWVCSSSQGFFKLCDNDFCFNEKTHCRVHRILDTMIQLYYNNIITH